jgi:nucleotide-binding universal stress UspA family protein
MRIVLGADGSDQSRNSETFLQSYPLRKGTEVFCCAVFSPAHIVTAASHPFIGPILSAQIDLALAADKENAKENAKASARRMAEAGFDAHAEVLEGDPAHALAAFARAKEASFVAVGSQGAGFFDTILLGSVARSIANESELNVLVTRGTASNQPLRAVFATDHSDFARGVAEKLPKLVEGKFASLRVVSVMDPDSKDLLYAFPKNMAEHATWSDLEGKLEEWLKPETAKVAQGLAGIAESVSSDVLYGNTRKELAGIRDCDLMIVGSHGRSGLKRLLLGSVSHYVLTRAPFSVMIVRR